MSDSQEKSDDLIAELAKLMATNAQGSESEPKSTVIKLAPLGEAAVPPPVRIPGMATPATPPPLGAAAKPATPVVRIPGMERPPGVETPGPTVAPPRPLPPRSPVAPPLAAAPAVPPPAAGPTVSPPAPQAPERPAAPQGAAPAMPPPAQPHAAAGDEGFKFDFGFGTGGGGGESDAQTPQEPPAPAPGTEHDPIADLIAAELDAAQAAPATPSPPTPAPGLFPPSVDVVPARTFGATSAGQAPVLVARPVGTPPRPAPAPSAFRPPQATPKQAESDKFAVAPVFGLASRPGPAPTAAPPAPPPLPPGEVPPAAAVEPAPPALDPMDEIENLIGEAVRVELAADDEPTPAPQPQAPREVQPPVAPVVPPLTTGFAPRRAGLKDNEPQVRSAEAAILAAAAATGAEVGRLGPASGDDSPYKRPRGKAPGAANPFAGLRQYVGLAVAGTLLLAAGFGVYWVLGMGRGTTEAPVLTADATPAKQPPAPADAATEEAPRSVVFDEINGVAAADDAETLVSRDETAGADVAEVARVVAEPPAATESGLANRKVRTVTVRPDGTIVSGDEAIAGSEALPVDRPNVPVVPGASVEPSDLLTAAVGEAEPLAATPEPDPIAAVITDGQAPAAGAPPVEMAALAPAGTTPPVFDASLVAPVPMPRPVDRNALRSAAPAPASTLAELPLVGLDAPAAAPATAAAAYVQISSQPTEADAQAAVRSAQARWGSLFNGNQLIVQRADLGAKGVKYRVRLPAASLQEATQICASIKADGGDCFATNG